MATGVDFRFKTEEAQFVERRDPRGQFRAAMVPGR